jgi:hypothetical protein
LGLTGLAGSSNRKQGKKNAVFVVFDKHGRLILLFGRIVSEFANSGTKQVSEFGFIGDKNYPVNFL